MFTNWLLLTTNVLQLLKKRKTCEITLKFLYNKTNRRTNFQIYSSTKLYMFRAVYLPIIRSFALYTRHWHMLYKFDDS